MNVEAYFEKIGQEIGTEAKQASGSLFGVLLKDDVGKLAIDAVNYAARLQTRMETASARFPGTSWFGMRKRLANTSLTPVIHP